MKHQRIGDDSQIKCHHLRDASSVRYVTMIVLAKLFTKEFIHHRTRRLLTSLMSQAVYDLAHLSSAHGNFDETQACALEFFRRHLCWTDSFLDAAIRSAKQGFFYSMLINTREFLAAEQSVWVSA